MMIYSLGVFAVFFPVIPRWGAQNVAVRTRHPPETHSLQHGEHTWHAVLPVAPLRVMSSHFINCFCLCCSTWAAWRRPGRWQISWLLTSACRKTPQVALLSNAGYFIHMPISPSELWLCHRGSLLVDHPSSLQAEVWRREGQGWRWPHPCQCFFRALPGNHYLFTYMHLNSWFLLLNVIHFTHNSAFFFSISLTPAGTWWSMPHSCKRCGQWPQWCQGVSSLKVGSSIFVQT